MAARPSGNAHTAYVVDSVTTTAVPDCRLCKRIDAVGTLPKRLIVCCDGTSNSSNQGVETNPTNIARLSRAIANVGYTTDGTKVPQIVYYQSGIGTDPSVTEVTKIRQQSLGAGLNVKVCEAYNYLANNYGPGDEIFIFGFSVSELDSLVSCIAVLTLCLLARSLYCSSPGEFRLPVWLDDARHDGLLR